MSEPAPCATERRRHPRICIKERAEAMLSGPELAKGIQILDISARGVAFRYVAGYHDPVEPLELDILWDHLDVVLLKLKLRVVSDYQLPDEYLLGVIPIRRCGAEFVDLTEDQKAQLERFIQNCDMDELTAHSPRVVDQTITPKEEKDQWKVT